MKFKIIKSYIVSVLLFLVSCGGGTSGSGLKTYEGRITTTDGMILSNATVTIESTGDSSLTDQEGNFNMTAYVKGSEVPFLIEVGRLTARFIIKNPEQDSSRVQLEVKIDPKTSSVESHDIEIKAGFVGLCDPYFENAETIRQANHVPSGTICSLNVSVRGDGELLSEVPVALQYAGCGETSPWKTISIVGTGTGRHTGFLEINFEFVDSTEFCRYRVIAPFGGYSSAVYPIDTFTEQEYYSNSK